ncbi:hypothetical protein PENVUL_c038G01456 [Penicillium vulpinum]|uniref:Uncharacterized protein n=1 Tax=Penicillium vulpinum TaxID=29845 RepID=A0A1V6RMV6_9EURO|nr:hypothetical protein PENVUL_c038G01456 [Penicillium vulpinum]
MLTRRHSLFRISGTNKLVKDPKGKNISWVTVELPSSMNAMSTDQMLLEFVIREIRSYRALIYDEPQHWIRQECISLPVINHPDPHPPAQAVLMTLAKAEDLVECRLKER